MGTQSLSAHRSINLSRSQGACQQGNEQKHAWYCFPLYKRPLSLRSLTWVQIQISSATWDVLILYLQERVTPALYMQCDC